MKAQSKAYILAITAVLLWSTAATAFKISLQLYNYLQLLFIASLTSTLFLLIVIITQGKFKKLFSYTAKEYLWSALLGFLNPFLYYIVLLKAYSILPAQVAQPLNYTWPIVLVFLAAPLLKQKLKIRSVFALLISFSGVYFISSQGKPFSTDINEPLGVFLATISSVIWALFWIFNVKDKRTEIEKLFSGFVFGTVFILIYLLSFSEFPIFNLYGLLSSMYVGMFEMGLTFVLWLMAMQLTSSADKISNLVFLSPFVSLIFIHFIIGEEIFITTLLGIFLILVGIFTQQMKFKKNWLKRK
ncbi:MAG: EamA family transporter [Marinilabiliales bacterium]|nr:MAG: EamA family transporter [Marinilabiliales bacterium]